eukprot:CAMPEP_0170483336 /NCGR_PEP_ID=MMETSP0208-20121228/3028_1 /TAXON_ID=197538 /ORGANISM="Strombidium inclinatum, Strain S3" /LENGTH=59 /DNA_ID=CAMNT_0010756331 /DNA_START=657 /DNA_END=836 /DNA_ORIENTATION=-
MNLYQFFNMAFTVDIGFKKVPVMGKLAELVDTIFIPRGSTEEKRQQIINQIVERQTLIE